jgi:hypothetical protein
MQQANRRLAAAAVVSTVMQQANRRLAAAAVVSTVMQQANRRLAAAAVVSTVWIVLVVMLLLPLARAIVAGSW